MSVTSSPVLVPTTRARRVVRELYRPHVLSNWLFDFTVEGDQVVATPPAGSALRCGSYTFPRGWGSKRIDAFLLDVTE